MRDRDRERQRLRERERDREREREKERERKREREADDIEESDGHLALTYIFTIASPISGTAAKTLPANRLCRDSILGAII